MNWTTVKDDLRSFAPFLAQALDFTGPVGALAGGVISAALGTPNNPESVHAELASNPQALAKVRLAEINNAGALQQALIENATAQKQVDARLAENPWLIAWESLIGYDCALALTWQWFLLPVIDYALGLFHVALPDVPQFDTETLITILGALLGTAAFHITRQAVLR